MIRVFVSAVMCLCGVFSANQLTAHDFSGLALSNMESSRVIDNGTGLQLDLSLSQGVPWRVFTLIEPPRLVLDFREVDWQGFDLSAFDAAERAVDVRVGGFRPGWSRMVVELAGPFGLASADMDVDVTDGTAALKVRLAPKSQADFAAESGMPNASGWDGHTETPVVNLPPKANDDDSFVVIIDPGHGGIDPGAEQGGVMEKNLMLAFAKELKEVLLRREDMQVILTRQDDSFVSLERRVAIAHQAGADLFLSLHADALSEGKAEGATVYTLSERASDKASAAMAERHNRADLMAGVDLTGTDDVVADVLMDLARLETKPRAIQLRDAIHLSLQKNKLPLNARPLREAGFSVLKSPDIPSVLLELGFLSSEKDRKNISDPKWRAEMAKAVGEAISAWRLTDAAVSDLVRQ
ncbi:MAG: N-acetylmuramoyl-L-alanine amidase [Pseudomonadota bacterium]